MSLLEELKEKRIEAVENIDELKDELSAAEKEAANARRSITFWETHISELDKAIAALSTETEGGLLDDNQLKTSPVQSASDQDKLHQEDVDKYKAAIKRADSATDKEIDAAVRALQEKDRQERVDDFKSRYPGFTKPPLPEGFIPWSGGECPVSKDQVVELLFRESWAGDGSGRAIYISDPADYADLTQWKHHGQGGDIIAYRVVESPTYAERTEDVSQAETATEQTLITDDIPSIPREEIPIGAAVETYTDSGIETVKISGTTYVVDDEPVAEASYAPINSEPASDALMWANGFEADAKAKAEPEQDKRPFWTRAPKPKVNA